MRNETTTQRNETMTTKDRDRLREKQDHLIYRVRQRAGKLGVSMEHCHLDEDKSSSPTIAQMEKCIFPQWEARIDEMLKVYN